MSNYEHEVRRRSRTLLIVEGNHEKNKLFWLIFKCFPEIKINMEDVWIYKTNIYILYDDIVKEYGYQWAEEHDDIDLPLVISKKQQSGIRQYKEDFTNIILVFDYERHDTNFSEVKIMQMQGYFHDAADMGKLYINYPMIESYQHLCRLPDRDYAERKIPVSLQPGKEYKALVAEDTVISSVVEFPHRIEDLLKKHLNVGNVQMRENCCNKILNISDTNNMAEKIQMSLYGVVETDKLLTVTYQLMDWVARQKYAHSGQTYWEYTRNIFRQIIRHNICKANRIQYDQYQIAEDTYKDCFEKLDLTEILKIQNSVSKNESTGFIWVLNTCVLFVAEYNFALAENHITKEK